MKKVIFFCFQFIGIISICLAQPDKSIYSESQRRQARENAETNRHYEEIKPRSSSSNNAPISGDYDAYQMADDSKMKGIRAAEARQKKAAEAFSDKERKLAKIIADNGLQKSKLYYPLLLDAARMAGFDSYWAKRTFGDDVTQFENFIAQPSYQLHNYFPVVYPSKPVESKPVQQSNVESKPIQQSTPASTKTAIHPKSYSAATPTQLNNGYKQFNSLKALLDAIVANGHQNYSDIIDKETKYVNDYCRCDAVYGFKYYWKNYAAPEYGVFNGAAWKYPFIRYYLHVQHQAEAQQVFNEFKTAYATAADYKRVYSKYSDSATYLEYIYNKNNGVAYQVWIELKKFNSVNEYTIRIGIDKKDEAIDPNYQKSNAVKENVTPKEKPASNNLTTSLKNINSFFTTFDNGYCKGFEVKNDEIYLYYKNDMYNRAKISDIESAIVEAKYNRVILKCKGTGKCIYSSWFGGGYYEYIQFTSNISFDMPKLANLLNDFVAACKAK